MICSDFSFLFQLLRELVGIKRLLFSRNCFFLLWEEQLDRVLFILLKVVELELDQDSLLIFFSLVTQFFQF